MIKTETITINGRTFVRTYSNASRMIKQDGSLVKAGTRINHNGEIKKGGC